MTTITFPSSPKPSGMSWRLVQPAQQNVSQWTGARQVLASGRGWWECSITFPPIVGESAINSWRAFMGLARGASDPAAVRAQVEMGIAQAAPYIIAAAQNRTLKTAGRTRLPGTIG